MAISPPDGHLGFAWEVAVVSAFVVVIIAVVVVVVFQIRRRKRREREHDLENGTVATSARANVSRQKSKRKVEDVDNLKKGDVVPVKDVTSDDEYSDEDIEVDSTYTKGSLDKKSKHSSRTPETITSKSKPSMSKSKSSRTTKKSSRTKKTLVSVTI